MTNPRIEEIRKRNGEDEYISFADVEFLLDELAKAEALLGECWIVIENDVACECMPGIGCRRCILLDKIRRRG